MSYAMYSIVPRPQTRISSEKLLLILEMLARLAAAGGALVKNWCVFDNVFLVVNRGFVHNRESGKHVFPRLTLAC